MLPSLIEIYNQIDDRGFTIIPYKIDEENYTVSVWLDDNYLRRGKETYPTWEMARDETYRNIYKHLNKIK